MRVFKALALFVGVLLSIPAIRAAENPQPFGPDFPNLDNAATGEWWKLNLKTSERPNRNRRPKT